MKKQSIYFLVIIILLVQTSCQQNNEEEDFFNNQITLLENNPRLYLSKIDSTQVTNLNNSKEATHFLLVSLANYYVNNYYPPKEVLQKSIHIFTKKKLIQQQLESLLFLAKTYKKEKNLKMEVQAIEKAIDIASQIEDKEWLCCLYGYLGDMYIRKYNMLKFIKYQTLANQCIEDIAFRDMDISTQVQTAKSFLYIGNHKKSYELLNLIESSIDKNNIYYNEIKCLQGITLFKTKQWALCIEKLQEAIILSQTDDFLFVCHSILTYCYYSINDLANANKHRKLAIEYDTDSETNFAEIEFYKLCAEFARENNYIDNQIDCLYKAIERYEILLRNLNGSSLDEAIQAYTHFCDKKNYEKKLSTYKYAALSSLFIASIGLLIYINKKRKQAYQIVALHQQIETLEGLNNMKWGHMKHWDDGIYYGVASLVVKQKIKNPSFDTVLDENRKEFLKKQWQEAIKHNNFTNASNSLTGGISNQWNPEYNHSKQENKFIIPYISVIDDFFGTTNISKKIEDALIRQGANFLKSYVNSHKTQSTQLVCISQREKTAYSLFRNDLSWNGGGYRVKETFLRYYRNIVFSIKIKGDKTTPGADLGDNDFVGKPEIVSCEAIVYTKDGDGWIGAKIEKK